jgi:hypothetical protein
VECYGELSWLTHVWSVGSLSGQQNPRYEVIDIESIVAPENKLCAIEPEIVLLSPLFFRSFMLPLSPFCRVLALFPFPSLSRG